MKNKNSDLTVSNNSNQNLLYNFTKIFKMNRILFLIIFLISSNNFYSQDVPTSERNALITIFNTLNGTNWNTFLKSNWKTNNPVSTWGGISVDTDSNGQLHVTEIDLVDNNLKGNIPIIIKDLSYLRKLYIGSGNISSIPNEIGNLSNLNDLLLISSGAIQIPSSLGNLNNLNYLTLEATSIDLPSTLGNLTNLRFLSLFSSNSLQLPSSIENLINLNTIILDSSSSSIFLPSTFGNLPNLNSIILSSPLMSSFPTVITNLKNTLTSLTIEKNKILNFPSEVTTLLKLKYFSFYYYGNFTSFPPDFSNLNLLENININDPNKKITCENPLFFSYFPNLSQISYTGVTTSKYFDLSKNKKLRNVYIDSEKLVVVNFSNGTNNLTYNIKFGNTLLKNIKCISVDNPTNAQNGTSPYNWTVNWFNNTKNYLSDCSVYLSTNNFSKPNLKIFPNPVKNILYIESEGNKINGEIYSTNGQFLKLVSSKEINISDLKKGVYILKLNTENGIFTQKIIKE